MQVEGLSLAAMKCNLCLIVAIALACTACLAHEGDPHHTHAPTEVQPTVSSVIGSHMVLQRGVDLPISGTAQPGTPIKVTLVEATPGSVTLKLHVAGADQPVNAQVVVNEITKTTVAKRGGEWRVKLPALKAGGPYTLAISIGDDEPITYTDILIGDVWVCSGQSNMQWALRGSSDGLEAVRAADHPRMRLFTVGRNPSPAEVQPRVEGEWRVCQPQTAAGFSAVGYYFGRMLQQELGVPIGLIDNSWGGMPAQTYTSRRTLETQFPEIIEYYNQAVANYDQAYAQYEQAVQAWENQAVERIDTTGGRPRLPYGPQSPNAPAALYNGMTVALADLPITGVIWYQGESDAGNPDRYARLFPAMINDWRDLWDQPDLPFLFVQLANFREAQTEPVEAGSWAGIRQAQARALELPHTAMAVTIDVGEADDIHPRDKKTVGQRLARAALAKVYDRDIVYAGPMYQSMKIENGTIRLTFDHVGSGLTVKGDQLKGFAIAGRDGAWHWANATIDGDTVIVKSADVPDPTAVRYGWANNPPVNLYNKEGLPASPFRTDAPTNE